MGTMSARSTYAFDTETVQLIKQLATTWGVSQAEVIRRSIRLAVATNAPSAPTPAEVVEYYRTHMLHRDRAETERRIAEQHAQRQDEDLRRTGRHG